MNNNNLILFLATQSCVTVNNSDFMLLSLLWVDDVSFAVESHLATIFEQLRLSSAETLAEERLSS